ncbi:hypothetical protein DE146DRAFT_624421 [Phaeosphaeria sp. MPI-PUGE-AT-0046c]|nr:hypothetical protein DE146DRAFT_624421 [Phaeosphaeria sp. MPI-PUGE-AT-0046c]
MGKGNVIDPAARDKYLLQESDLVTCFLKVRIKDYHGLPHGSPSSSPYFEHSLHTSDRYSIAFSFVPKQDFSGQDLVIGFDYDHSIKHQLPPGFKYAMKIATSMLDPGLYSDAYCDEPYLYGPALSGLFTLNVGEKTDKVSASDQLSLLAKQTGGVVEEGGTGSGATIRKDQNIPSKWKKRRKHFLSADALAAFTFEKGRMYHCDFFNPHLDFANFSLRLPGFSISVAKYIDEKTHHLRYVLRNRSSGDVLFVVFFKLLFGEELERTLEERKGEKEEVERQRMESVQASADETGNRAPVQDVNVDGGIDARPQTQPKPRVAEVESDEDDSGYSASAAVTSLSNNIYAAFVAMGLWDEPSSSSSESEAQSREPSPQRSGRSLESRVDDMDDATVEKYLQSRYGST